MKRISKFINIPCQLFDTNSLSILAKWVLIAVDSVYDGNPQGVRIGVQTIAGMTNLPSNTVKDILNELYEYGALEVTLVDGAKYIKPLMYKPEYAKIGDKVSLGDSPRDTEQYDWDEIQAKWSEYCPTLPEIARWTPQRKRKLRSALKSADLTLHDLYKCFRIIGSTAFLNGTSNQFKAHFDWCISKSQNLSKIYEGFYSKSYQEQCDYAVIMGHKTSMQKDSSDNFYR